MSKSKVLFMMTGSIACYKACQVISRLVQNNCEVQVVATPAALQFVGNATFEGLTGKTAVSDLYAPGSVMDHIHLMRWADLILVAPATANFINKAAAGLADDLVSTLFLAHDFKKPFLVAPAMNTSMYLHPTTQSSLKKLQAMGVELLDTAAGILACGEEGYGRLLEPDQIQKRTLEALNQSTGQSSSQSAKKDSPSTAARLAGKPVKVLVTAGGTQEPIDTVRVISNVSSGRTGVQMAQAFAELGCEVLLLRAHGSAHISAIFSPNSFVGRQETFTDFESLRSSLEKHLSTEEFTHVIHAAAVSDYSLASIEMQGEKYRPLDIKKLNSDADEMTLHLKKNPKIVDQLKSYSKNKNLQVVAFKLTSQASTEQRLAAVKKLQQGSHADFVVHNDLTEIDLKNKTHRFNLYAGTDKSIPCENINQLIAELSVRMISQDLDGGRKVIP